MNHLTDRVVILPFALGAESKAGFIQVEGNLETGEGTGTANVLPEDSTYDCVRQPVHVETLDELASRGLVPRGCSVVKIDTDGYDLKVLQGATEFLMRERPIIFGEFSAECLGWHGQSLDDVAAFARDHGYEAWMRARPGWKFSTSPGASRFEQDVLLAPEEAIGRLRHLLAA